MDDYRRSQIPAFGNWDYANDLPITQYFESARQAGLIRYSSGDRDLYVVDDFYGDDLKKPAKTVVSRHKAKGAERRYPTHVKEQQRKQGRVCDVTEPPSPEQQPHPHPPPRAPKAVDEDLYKIPPELLHNYPKRKKLGFFSCLVPACVA